MNSYEQKLQIVKDRVELTVKGFTNGFYLYGEGGIGKSYTILNKLDEMETDYVLHNTRMSASAFFDKLREHRHHVHVLEECEDIFTDRQGMNLLRSACWGQKDETFKQRRYISWNVKPEPQTIEFCGSIIFTGNRPLSNVPELRALRTRIAALHLEITREEMLEVMEGICRKGYKSDKGKLKVSECMEIFDFYKEAPKLDLRILIRAFDERMGCRDLKLTTSWKDMLNTAMMECIETIKKGPDRIEIAKELAKMRLTTNELEREWKERTGKTISTYYRILKREAV